MKNIFVLPTKEESILGYLNGEYILTSEEDEEDYFPGITEDYRHIYITNDAPITPGSWYLHYCDGKPVVSKIKEKASKSIVIEARTLGYKKIILTSDEKLIDNDVQAIEDDFLDWFVENQGCEEVKIYSLYVCSNCGDHECDSRDCRGHKDVLSYLAAYPGNIAKKIVTLCDGYEVEEERISLNDERATAKQNLITNQENLEEAAEEYASGRCSVTIMHKGLSDAVKFGATWQQQRVHCNKEGSEAPSYGVISKGKEGFPEDDIAWWRGLNNQKTTKEHNYLKGFIDQFTEGHLLNELSVEDWTVSRFLLWLEANKFEIIKHNGSN